MKKEAQLLEDANMAAAKSKAALLAAQLNRSVTRHSLREHTRRQMVEAGEKVTEARLDDIAVADSKYQEVCQSEVNATLAEGEACAKAKKALCDYEIAVVEAKAK
jgi:hypothetical protein